MNLKKRLAEKRPTIGSWLSLRDVNVCEMMARLGGFEWLVVDMEHTAIGVAEMSNLIQVTDLCGLDCLVRVGANDPLLIKQALDSGARGIIVPQINTPEEARQAAASAYYPPAGNRGAGLFRAQAYGGGFADYQSRAASETVVIVQIEHHVGVANLAEIMATDGVDAFFVGPYDLSASLDRAGQFDHPDVVECLDRIAAYAETGNKAAGIHVVEPDADTLRKRISDGFSLVAYGTDMLFLNDRLAAARATVESVQPR